MIPPYQHGIEDGDEWEPDSPPTPSAIDRARDACLWAVVVVAMAGFFGWLIGLIFGGER